MSKFWSSFVKELVSYVPGEQPKLTITGEVARADRSDRSSLGLQFVKFDVMKTPGGILPGCDLAVLAIGIQLIECILAKIDLIHQRRLAGGNQCPVYRRQSRSDPGSVTPIRRGRLHGLDCPVLLMCKLPKRIVQR